MITKGIWEDLPDIYRLFFPSFFSEQFPAEALATCRDCAMCAKADEPRLPNVQYFQPSAKCCTFYPKLPNYLVGGLLQDQNTSMEEGRRRIRERIASKISVTPHGISPPKKFSSLLKLGGDKSFGKNRSLLCPYYLKEEGNCSIWKFREAVCSTYFCKSVAGPEGKKFWNTLKMYLLHVQDCLIWYCFHEMDIDTEKMWDYLNAYNTDPLDPEDVDELPLPEEIYQGLWGAWLGKEEEFFLESHQLVQDLSQDEFVRITGITQQIMQDLLKKRRQIVVSPELPIVLKQNPEMKMQKLNEEESVVLTMAGFFRIRNALYEVMQLFDGIKTTEEIARIVEEQYNDTLRADLLLPMYHNRMLLPTQRE